MTTIDVNECPGSASREEKVPATEKSSEKSRAMADEKNATTPNESGEAVAVEFNLSDPEQLERQLARVDLTEEESDQLLREAYKVNKQLKMILKQKQSKIAASLRSQSADSTVSQKSGFRVLPPINSKGGNAVPERSMKAYGQSTTKSAMQTNGKPRTKSAKSKSTSQRPQWDDRFSFS